MREPPAALWWPTRHTARWRRADELLYSRRMGQQAIQPPRLGSYIVTVTDPSAIRSTTPHPYSLLLPLREQRVELGDAVLGVREEVRLHLQAESVHYVDTMRNDEESTGGPARFVSAAWPHYPRMSMLVCQATHACAGWSTAFIDA